MIDIFKILILYLDGSFYKKKKNESWGDGLIVKKYLLFL